MKRPFSGLILLLAGAFIAHAQGTVFFDDYTSLGSYLYVRFFDPYPTPFQRNIGGSSSGPPATLQNWESELGNGNDWTIALFGAPGANVYELALSPLNSAATGEPLQANLANGVSDTIAGTWFSVDYALVPGTYYGQTATLQLRAWYNDGGLLTSYSEALAANVPWAWSQTANVTLGGQYQNGPRPPGYPAILPGGLGNVEFALIPEPETLVLDVLGASILFLLRPRKAPA